MANSVIFTNQQTELPKLEQDKAETFTVFVTLRDTDKKAILKESPEALVMGVDFLRGDRKVSYKEYTKTFILEGIETWESGEVEGLTELNVMIMAPEFIETNASGEKALSEIRDYFRSLGCQTTIKTISAGKTVEKMLEQDSGFLYEIPETRLPQDEGGGSSAEAEHGYDADGDMRTILSAGGQPDFLLQKLNETVEKKQDGTFYVLPGGEMGNVVYDAKKKKYQVVNYSKELLNLKLTKWVCYLNSKGAEDFIPKTLLNGYASQGVFPGVNALEGIASAPVLGPDLIPRLSAGYDESTSTYVVNPIEEPLDYEEAPSREAAQEAAQRLLEWFSQVAFEYESSQADALAFALTPLLIRYMPDCPIPGLMIMADRPNSGKTSLARMVSYLSGENPDVKPLPSTNEMKTMITTTLNSENKVCIFDNIKVKLDSHVLESLITSRDWSDRGFHSQKSISFRNDNLWIFTKNTPEASDDMLRRLVILPMSKKADPTKKWDTNTLKHVQERRIGNLVDLLTMIMFWKSQGENWGSAEYEGFDEWAGVVSGILESAGVSGFLSSREDSKRRVDTGSGEKAEMLLRVARVMGTDQKWTLSDLQDAVELGEIEKLDLRSKNLESEDGLDKSEAQRLRDLVLDKKAVWRYLNGGSGDKNKSQGRLLAALVGDDISPEVKMVQTKGRSKKNYYHFASNEKYSITELMEMAQY